jgi:hypothetical protein
MLGILMGVLHKREKESKTGYLDMIQDINIIPFDQIYTHNTSPPQPSPME